MGEQKLIRAQQPFSIVVRPLILNAGLGAPIESMRFHLRSQPEHSHMPLIHLRTAQRPSTGEIVEQVATPVAFEECNPSVHCTEG